MKRLVELKVGEIFAAKALELIFKAYLGWDHDWTAWHSVNLQIEPPMEVSDDILRIMSSHRGYDIEQMTTIFPDHEYLAIKIHETGQVLVFQIEGDQYKYLGDETTIK